MTLPDTAYRTCEHCGSEIPGFLLPFHVLQCDQRPRLQRDPQPQPLQKSSADEVFAALIAKAAQRRKETK